MHRKLVYVLERHEMHVELDFMLVIDIDIGVMM